MLILPLDIATSPTVPLTQKVFPTYSLFGSNSAVKFTVESRIIKSVD